jgi:antitoxin Phd
MATWQLQNAKTHLSEVIEDAHTKGPQIITRHGAERAVVISIEEYGKLTYTEPKPNLRDFLLNGPKFDDADLIDITRDRDTGREIDL